MDNHGQCGRGASDRGDPDARRPGGKGQPAALAHLFRAHFPEARIQIADEGRQDQDVALIDITMDDFRTRVTWSAKQGFGISLAQAPDGVPDGVPDHAHPDEIYAGAQLAATRLRMMIESVRAGITPQPMNVSEVRKLLGCRQRDVAARLSVQQASISRFEARRNPTLGALRAVAEAIGCTLEVRIRSAGIDVPIILPEPTRDE
jgi:hypothetical protein